MFEVKVTIGLKKGVSDPEGANTLKALKLLGFNNVKEAKMIRTVDLLIDDKNKDEVMHWADQCARKVIEEHGDKDNYTVAAGITPSGTIHMGNFREIITQELVKRGLESLGKKVRFMFTGTGFPPPRLLW